jgi:hypothetical protein
MRNDFSDFDDSNNPWLTDDPREALINMSLEHLISEIGEKESDKEEKPIQKSISGEPDPLAAIMDDLEWQQTKGTQGETQRLVIKMGIAVVEDRFHKPIKDIATLRHQILESGDVEWLYKSRQTDIFKLIEFTGDKDVKKVSMRLWQSGYISKRLSAPLHIPFSTATILLMLAGITKSTLWVPRKWIPRAERNLDNFKPYLEKQIEDLSKILKG